MARSGARWPGVYQLLSEKYPAYPVARLLGDAAKPLPVWAELAPAEQWQDIEAPLGRLDLSEPVPDLRTWRYWEPCDPRGEEEFKRHLDEWDRQLRAVHAGRREHLKTWNQLTYDLGAMTRDEHGGLRLDCKLGTYYHSLSTSEYLDAELHADGQQRDGRRLVALFGCLYYAALRPEEAISLAKHNLSLPTQGSGELHVERAEPYAGKEWTDSGRNRDQRPLKQRARGEVRHVPCPPPLTALLHAHIQEFGVQPDGRLFVGERNDGELPTMTIGRVWRRARQAAFTAEVAASPLARTPYDLRHAAVSTWLNGGMPPTTVARVGWAIGRGLAQDLRQVPRRK